MVLRQRPLTWTRSPSSSGQQIILRIAVSQVLPESLGIRRADQFPAPAAHRLHGLDVFIHAVLFQEPLALAGMAGEHAGLRLDHAGGVHDRRRIDGHAQQVFAFDRVGIVQVGYRAERGRAVRS